MSDELLNAVIVREKKIYPPATISIEAQRLLSSGSATPPPNWPGPDQVDEWSRFIDQSNRMWVEQLALEKRKNGIPIDEIDIGGVKCYSCAPSKFNFDADALYLFIHGGAFVNGAGAFAKILAARNAAMLGMRTISIDYRMPPQSPFPVGLHDCLTVYQKLIASRGAAKLFLAGSSAGGNLAAALTLMIRDRGMPLPSGLILLTPEVDLTESGDTFRTNQEVDIVLKGSLRNPSALYAAGHDLSDPYISPLFGDFYDFPPTLLQSGTRDLLLSNTVLMHRKLRAKGVAAELHVWEAMPHGSYGLGDAPEHREIYEEIARFIRRVMTPRSTG